MKTTNQIAQDKAFSDKDSPLNQALTQIMDFPNYVAWLVKVRPSPGFTDAAKRAAYESELTALLEKLEIANGTH